MFMIAGIKYGYSDPHNDAVKAEHYRLIQSLALRFQELNGSYICRQLLHLEGTDNPVPEARNKAYYKTRPCGRFVRCAAQIMDECIRKKSMVGKKMKIVVASEGKTVAGHFGHCENFLIFDAENNCIVKSVSLPNPGHRPGFLPNYLSDLGVNVIIAGGMGGGAVEIFNEKNIEVIVGASGDAQAAAENYLQGALHSTISACHEHQHHGACVE